MLQIPANPEILQRITIADNDDQFCATDTPRHAINCARVLICDSQNFVRRTEMLMISTLILVFWAAVNTVDCQDDITWTRQECREMMESCELLSGLPGPTGSVGSKGALGQLGIRGDKGNKGFPGEPGNPGIRGGGYPMKGQKGQNGDIGAKGAKGFRGGDGPSGVLGVQGSLGSPGLLGDFGRKGGIGPPGEDGEPGMTKLNWKQCVFTPDMNTARGEIVYCTFFKERSDTSLHVTYQGETHIGLCENCCKAWYFTFDNLTCTDPGSVDAVFSSLHLSRNGPNKNTLPDYMHGTISGYCSSVPRGSVRVGLSLDNCPGYPTNKLTFKGVIQPNSRIIIQEVPAPQV